jgi:hypothetical protein
VEHLSCQIADVLFGSRRIRFGNAPTPDEHAYMANMIDAFIRDDLPIAMTTCWGPLKCYGLLAQVEPDEAEVLGMARFANLDVEVKHMYPRGLSVRVLLEDLGERVLNTHCPDLSQRMLVYMNKLTRMTPLCVKLVSERELLDNMGLARAFVEQAQNNRDVILRYLVASDKLPEERRGQLAQYHDLVCLGWMGTIPEVQRDHYYRRIGSEYPDAAPYERMKYLATYFAVTLTRVQMGLFKGDPRPLKVSFVPHPPGTPQGARLGRLEYKVKDGKNCKAHVPPWCAIAVQDDKGVHLVPHNHVTQEATHG